MFEIEIQSPLFILISYYAPDEEGSPSLFGA